MKVIHHHRASLGAQWLRICLPSRRCGFDPWVRKNLLEKEMALQDSCLGNPMDRGV